MYRFILSSGVIASCLWAGLALGQVCSSDEDCGPSEVCEYVEQSQAGCPPDTECVTAPQEPIGSCELPPLQCDSNSECPEPTVCVSSECVYKLLPCEVDGECSQGYGCTDVLSRPCSGEGEQSDGELQAMPPVLSFPDAGTPAEDDQEECTDIKRPLICFPLPVSCVHDGDCEDGWTCGDADAYGPALWEDFDRVCLPPGLTALIEGRVSPDDSLLNRSGPNTSLGGSPGGLQEPTMVPSEGAVAQTSGTQGGSEGTASCSASGAGRVGNPVPRDIGTALLLIGLVFWVRKAEVQ